MTTVRSLAFYLPQFHPIPENDEWWGKGFTEWTNVTHSTPRFAGHAQPRLPRDLGFYDLRTPETRHAQAAFAKAHGIDGFIYYHYWFNGRRVLERPFDDALADKSYDMGFALCWANEDWRRNWDGRSGEVLLPQGYSEQDDREHIAWILKAMADPRYIRIDDKPLLMVYRVALLPNPARTAEIWREEAHKAGIGDLYLCHVESMERMSATPRQIGFDATVEFAPDWENTGPATMHGSVESHEYLEMAARMLSKPEPGYKRFPCVTPGFDNTPRKGENGYVLTGSSPELYKGWVAATVQRETERGEDDVVMFVNAWNEWAEGATLEPCDRWGTAFAEAHAAGVSQGLEGSAETAEHNAHSSEPANIPWDQRPSVTIAMVVSADASATLRALQSAVETAAHQARLEFVVIDNGSTDETAAVLKAVADEVLSLRNETAVPLDSGWTQALRLVRTDYVVCLSNDIVLRPGWLTPLVEAIEADPSCVAASPAVRVNGARLPSQPLTSSTGVCLVTKAGRTAMQVQEARVVAASLVELATNSTILD